MSEQNNEPQVEKTVERTTETVETPGLADRREELRTPAPEVVKETVTEKVVDSDAGKGDE